MSSHPQIIYKYIYTYIYIYIYMQRKREGGREREREGDPASIIDGHHPSTINSGEGRRESRRYSRDTYPES
jgi:hypothetical protein